MRQMARIGMLTVVAAVCGWSQISTGAVTIEKLLDEMTDLERLAELPDPAYITRQFSSWDRAAKSPSENWFANGDSGQYLRTEKVNGREERVMMDADGPGAIVRIWSADPKGTLRIYLDNAETPAIEAPMKELLGGKVPNLPRPIAGVYASGWNLYFPIPYAKHCKVTSNEGGFYYHVNYRTYAKGTEVKSFARGDLERLAGRIERLARLLEHPPEEAEHKNEQLFLLDSREKGKEAAIEIKGPRAITYILAQFADVDAKRKNEILARGLVLKMDLDGENAVECPLGDFFGTAPGFNPYRSLPLKVDGGGKSIGESAWFMPFAKKARISLVNLGVPAAGVQFIIFTRKYDWTDRSLLFHAKWRIQRDIPTRPQIDWTHLECTGAGRFVGGMLHIINPVKSWWGEGDEKIYVDGETFPSHFGTGTEDYYGYAWGSSELYTQAYHNQTRCDGPGVYGNNSENRFHIIDDIPFTRSFKFDMENWHCTEGIKVTRAAVSYWYARPGGTDSFRPITAEDVQYTEVPSYPTSVGTIEGESLLRNVAENTGGEVRGQGVGEPFSNEQQLRWQANKPGDRLVLTFQSKKAGPQHVFAQFKKARDFAIVEVSVNGRKAGEPRDFYSKDVAPSGEIDLGTFDLKAGENQLALKVTGVNPAAEPKLLVGLDYIRLK